MKLKADKHYSYGITTATMGSQQQLWDHNSSYGITIAAASVVETAAMSGQGNNEAFQGTGNVLLYINNNFLNKM
jgi:hypothetical protein